MNIYFFEWHTFEHLFFDQILLLYTATYVSDDYRLWINFSSMSQMITDAVFPCIFHFSLSGSYDNKFTANHPKFVAFLNTIFSTGVTEGTVIEITVTRPGEEPITTNMKVMQSDLELMNELKDLAK